ncbi:MAG: tetratricopeptide repeat protein [Bdellovibrionaceae bacterium]|jgi:cellulose synthase operon protein C|nr:tetratricopeptide repeat protein [Pseudobdellovibrionaceae bacterium]
MKYIYILLFLFISVLHVNVEAKKRVYKTQTIGDIFQKIEKKSQKVKLKKAQTALPQIKKSRKTKIKKTELRSIKPPSSSKFIKGNSQEAELEKYTDREIKQLYVLTRQYRRSKRRGEIWLRLAEAYVDKSKIVEYRLQNEYDKNIIKYKKGKLKRRPKLSLKEASSYNLKAIKLYEWFLRDFPKDSKVDQAYFFLGYNYFELYKIDKALGYYRRLTKEFPKSKYVSEAYFAIAEYYFDNEKWQDALKSYYAVSKIKVSRLYTFALYKLAWCHYKSGNVKKAMAYLERVIREGRNQTSDSARKIRLADEAKKDLIPFFAELGAYKNAESYFSKVVRSGEIDRMIERLAYYYADTGNKKGARFYFKKMIRKNPNAPKSFEYQNQIVNLYLTATKSKIFKQELYHWVEYYGPKGRWALKNAKAKALVNKSKELVEASLRAYTLQNHQTAQNSHGAQSTSAAKNGYELYFKTFVSTPYLGDMHFFFGEMMFDLKKYKIAAKHYIWVVENDKKKKGKYYKKSLLNSILALEKHLPTDKEISKIVGKSKAKIPLDKVTKSFVIAASKFVKEQPKASNVDDIKYKLASLYYAYNHLDEAIEGYKNIVKEHPKSKYASSSGHLILDLYNKKKDYIALENAAQAMLKIPSIAKAKFGLEVKSILQRSSFKQAQDLESDKEFVKSAKAYERFALKYKKSKLLNSARFNAAVNYERSGDIGQAIVMYELVVNKAGNSNKPLVSQSRKILAYLYEASGQFKKAASFYEKSAAENRKNSYGADFYYNAAVLREGMRFYSAAINNYKSYYKLTKNKNKEEAYYYIAEIWNKRGKTAKAIENYKKYMNLNPKDPNYVVAATFKIAKLYEKNKNKKKYLKWYGKTIAVYKSLRNRVEYEAKEYAAESQFKLTYEIYLKFKAIKIPKNPAAQQKAVAKKLSLIEYLTKQLKKTIKYEAGNQTIASMSLIAQSYQHMMASVIKAPLPKGLNKEEVKIYKLEIKKVADKFKEQAIKNYEMTIAKAYEFEVYGKWVSATLNNLKNLHPEKVRGLDFKAYITRLPDDLENKKGLSKAPVQDIEALYKAKGGADEKQLVAASAKILLKHPGDLYTLTTLSLHYYNKKYFGLSKIILNRIVEAFPKEPSVYNNLAVVNLAEGNFKKALFNFRQSLKHNPDYQVASANLGSIYIEYLDYKRAYAPLENGFRVVEGKLKNKDLSAFKVANNYAIALYGKGELEKSKRLLKKLMDYGAREESIYINYITLVVNYMDDSDDALKVISKLKFISENQQILNKAKKLEEKIYEKDNK